MRISARNQIKGKIVEVKKGATTAHVRVEIAPRAGRHRPRSPTKRSTISACKAGGSRHCRHQGVRRHDRVRLGERHEHALHRRLPLCADRRRPRFAQEPVGCDKFKWPLDTERATAATAPTAEDRHPAPSVDAPRSPLRQIVALVPFADAKLPMPPERAPKSADTFAGFVQRRRAAEQPARYHDHACRRKPGSTSFRTAMR